MRCKNSGRATHAVTILTTASSVGKKIDRGETIDHHAKTIFLRFGVRDIGMLDLDVSRAWNSLQKRQEK